MTPLELYREAMLDTTAAQISGVGYSGKIKYGIRIVKEHNTDYVYICSTNMADDYVPLNPSELFILLKYGWFIGSIQLAIELYERRLIDIGNRIIRETARGIKGKNNLIMLKDERTELTSRLKKLINKRELIFKSN